MLEIKNYFTNNYTLKKLAILDTQKKWFATVFMLFITIITLIDPAFAQGFGKVESALDKIVTALTGSLAKSIAVIAVAGMGIAWIAGYIEMRRAFFVCIGIGIIFGAQQIVAMLSA
ncbi:TrbC/VirB2 family protein [Bartonella bilalgolemii]|uniref:TrbC/VirB2 family protein n=1 Tax=Bartonella bilalgolemii TaxID=2942911 RepID=A0ABT0P9Z9_9HYPH|nr:TrbC/VirB2 family protein [Bartonella sp. G70]MCL6230298.1 TrbC/VirB2 family protein [Bartonella sp. G70]